MGLVDEQGKLSFCDGHLRVVDAAGNVVSSFAPQDYRNHLLETVDPWSYAKPLHFKGSRIQGSTSEDDRIIYRVGPLARLNVASGLTTLLAQEESDRMFDHLGGKPVHNVWVYHWARLIELLHAAERMLAIADVDALTGSHIRNLPEKILGEGIGACEAPRGTLIHHYRSDAHGVVRELNLLVATQHNLAALSGSITQAARKFIRAGEVTEGLVNMVEMAFRAYDPCLACAVHAVDTGADMAINIRDHKWRLIKTIHR
ncbi:MAG TPA: hypothetical protein DCZ69_11930 [Syntrophobacteraceae bacterium]|nr:hypothetical protein [Syntrophobacteraceae bacterium]